MLTNDLSLSEFHRQILLYWKNWKMFCQDWNIMKYNDPLKINMNRKMNISVKLCYACIKLL